MVPSKLSLKGLVRRLVACLEAHAIVVEALYLFGSFARDEAAEQLRFGGLLFAGFIVSAVVLGWLMFPFPF